ncbi:MAG TPA: EAL domain-containing protein [Pyrinomonadaceae bacterium]|nr:EAL domain-containing protein [Pyrinomonadaceae bacterium]
MTKQALLKSYMLAVIASGFVCVAFMFAKLPFEKIDLQFVFLAVFTIGLGSRITIEIPRFKSHISVSDTFIFIALILYGGEFAVVLAAVEAFCSAWRFCNKKITVFFNMGAMALSTSLVVLALNLFGIDTREELHGVTVKDFAMTMSVLVLVQFFANSGIASVYGAMSSGKAWWETWKTHYLWTFVTYLIGALAAGFLVKLVDMVGFPVLFATVPVILFVYLTYRMYLKNVEMSLSQAEQAEQHAEILQAQSIALRESEERFRSAFNYAPIGIALVSPMGNWLKVNRALCEILGYTEDEFLATDFQSMISPDDLGNTLIKINELLSGKIPTCQMEQRYINKQGETVWAWWSVSSTGDVKSEQPNLIFQIQDITDKKHAEDKLQYDATHDVLTGLPNRKFFMTRLSAALEKSQHDQYHKVSVLFIDLDRFKIVNDSLGHLIGDELLIGIAERLRDCVRPSDTVARLGGDEFTVLVEGHYENKEVVRIAERVQEKFSIPFDLSGHEVYSSASIGILHATENHLTSEDMMRDADTAMYQAKRAGKARHEVFDEDMHKAAKETLKLETDLRRAVEKNEFTVHYQPIYSLITGNVEGFEALARWEHPVLGSVSPAKFVPLAEEIGIINALGEQILRKACTEMAALRRESPSMITLVLNVNLSCKQFAYPNLVQKIENILHETGFPPTKLKLEITESVFFDYREQAISMLNQLRALGIEINIDDFGTGYSNLSYLMQLPISTLKIDRSFISPIQKNGNNIEIVQTIVMMARNLGLRVIAEGVETEAQLEQLKKLKCEGAQGHLFSKPLSFDEVQHFLNENGILDIPDTSFKDISIVSTIQ